MTGADNTALRKLVSELGGRMIALRETPEELVPYAAFIPDSGYCVFVIPEVLSGKRETIPFGTSVPIPVKYVIKKGYRIENERVYCDVPYDDMIGADIPEEYYVFREEHGRQDEPSRNLLAIERGKVFAPVAGHQEGAYFVYSSGDGDGAGAGAMLIANYASPTADEIAQMQAGKALRIALFTDDGLMTVLFKFGTMEWMECPYNPALERAEVQNAILHGGDKMTLTAFMADCPSGKVVSSVRVVGIPNAFAVKLREAMVDALKHPVVGIDYAMRLQKQRMRYEIEDMVRDAVMVVDV